MMRVERSRKGGGGEEEYRGGEERGGEGRDDCKEREKSQEDRVGKETGEEDRGAEKRWR